MLDANWELINGPVAHEIEVLNAANQTNVLDGLIAFHLAHTGPMGIGNPPMPDEACLLALHTAATTFLLASPGKYRNRAVFLKKPDGTIVYEPPEWQDVPSGMQLFFRQLSSVWTSGVALDCAAYALWMINWVHPFVNGNGRTARAFSYACLSLRLGVKLPGAPTVVDQIMIERPEYEAALVQADAAYKATKKPDLSRMKLFLGVLLNRQISSVAATRAAQAAAAVVQTVPVPPSPSP